MKEIIVLLRSFFDICLFNKAPQDIPASTSLFSVCILSYISSSIILTLSFQDAGDAGISGLADVFLVIFITYILLQIRKHPERWVQTCTAMLGVGTLFALMALPFYLALAYEGLDGNNNFLLSIAIISLLLWNISVMAHILRHALNTLFAGGILISLLYVFVISSIIMIIAPREGL